MRTKEDDTTSTLRKIDFIFHTYELRQKVYEFSEFKITLDNYFVAVDKNTTKSF